nr:DUF1189 family protein [Vallitaleaceae bacterium]
LSKYEIGFLLDKTYMSLYSYGTEKTKISYDSFLLGEAENSEITSLISDNLSAIYPLLIAAFIISTIGFTVFCTLFILITTLFQRNILNLKLSYGDCLKITLYSLVMPLTLYQILLLLPVIPGIVTLLILFFLSSRKITVTLRLIKSELTPPKES